MTMTPRHSTAPTWAQPNALCLWHESAGGELVVGPGDIVAARHLLVHAVGDDAAMSALRTKAHALADGTDLSRLDEHQLVEHLAAPLADGRLRAAGAARAVMLYRLVAAPAPVSATSAPPASSPRASAAASAPAAVETTFGADVDVAAMVAVLRQAAQSGVPFCEECERAAAQRQAAGAGA